MYICVFCFCDGAGPLMETAICFFGAVLVNVLFRVNACMVLRVCMFYFFCVVHFFVFFVLVCFKSTNVIRTTTMGQEVTP